MPVPRPHTAMRKIRDVLRLSLGQGLSLRQVSASAQVPFSTAADYVRRARQAGLSWPLPEGLDDDALQARLFRTEERSAEDRPLPEWPMVHQEMRRKGVTLMLLWLEYKEANPDGYAYTQFTRLYKAWKRSLDVVMRQDHKAGERLFVDFPGETLPIYDPKTAQVAIRAELFVAALGASGYVYAEAFPSQELMYWVTAHVHTFEALGGVPEIVVCDNLRSGVTRPHRYEPDVNATYAEMAAHYRVAIMPARSYKPRDKAKAEVSVLLVERWILARLRKQRFTSLAQANEAIEELVAWVNDAPVQKERRVEEATVRPGRLPRPAGFAARALRVRHVAACQARHRLPHRGTRRAALLLGALQPGRRGLGRAADRVHCRGLLPAQPRRLPCAGPPARSYDRPRSHARVPPSPRLLDAIAHHLLGQADRAVHSTPGRRRPAEPSPPRTGLPHVPGHHPPGRALRQRPPGGGGRARRRAAVL